AEVRGAETSGIPSCRALLWSNPRRVFGRSLTLKTHRTLGVHHRLACLVPQQKALAGKAHLENAKAVPLHRNTLYRALKILEQAGVISMATKGHEAMLITVLIPRKRKGA